MSKILDEEFSQPNESPFAKQALLYSYLMMAFFFLGIVVAFMGALGKIQNPSEPNLMLSSVNVVLNLINFVLGILTLQKCNASVKNNENARGKRRFARVVSIIMIIFGAVNLLSFIAIMLI